MRLSCRREEEEGGRGEKRREREGGAYRNTWAVREGEVRVGVREGGGDRNKAEVGAGHRAAQAGTLECKLFRLQQLRLLITFIAMCYIVGAVRIHCITQLPGATGVNAGGGRGGELQRKARGRAAGDFMKG